MRLGLGICCFARNVSPLLLSACFESDPCAVLSVVLQPVMLTPVAGVTGPTAGGHNDRAIPHHRTSANIFAHSAHIVNQ
jgi:hypothetical protein